MIDSNNIDVIRKNIKELSEQNDETLYQVGEIENTIGGTQLLPEQTITSALNTRYIEPSNLMTGVSIDAGGYGIVGNMVVLNIRLNATSQIPNNTDVCDLPLSGIPEPYFVQALDQNNKKWRVVGNKLRTGETIASGVSIISLNYLTY